MSRGDLIERARPGDRRLVAVTAPAGYGKSTFLAQWAAREERPVAWVSLDRFDDDPATLLASLASAYYRAGLAGPDLVLDRSATRLAAEFRASPVPFVLVLDDLHQLRSPACHDVLRLVIAAIPRGSQLAAASRDEQPELPRLRAAADALEFGADDLALDASGARQIFASARISMAPELAAAVTERTEGWPAGLYMAALIAGQSRGHIPVLTGEDRYVADYLYREALAQQPKAIQRFLRRTAVLDQLCAPLCEAVVSSSVAAIHLRHVEAHSLFLTPLDRERGWYRYHALFREFLLGELRRVEPGIIATLHQRAADWYEANGSPARAIEHRRTATDLVPCFAIRPRLQLAKIYLALADPGMARQLLREIDGILIHRPALGTLLGEVEEFRRVMVSSAAPGQAGPMPLSPAELRLLPYLQTHLTAEMIAKRLFISGHTVKTEIKAIYRKLGVSSRDEAVRKATAIGLVSG